MSRRPEHLRLRGSIWWLRVRVPDELHPILGKTEVHRSLKTSDAKEAKRRVRIERLKTEAEFDDARQKLQASRPSVGRSASDFTLSDEQVWALVTRWFVECEKNTPR